jgi:predicted nucleic acid-binding protein
VGGQQTSLYSAGGRITKAQDTAFVALALHLDGLLWTADKELKTMKTLIKLALAAMILCSTLAAQAGWVSGYSYPRLGHKRTRLVH